jgi:hypothetical protein
VHDLGESFELTASLPAEPSAVGGRGLFIAAEAAGRLERRAVEMGGSEVTASLAVTRPPE